ncbi:Thoeris anti-defense Tad2 family protein [Xenorhabdus bovienii]|uniref:Thoeris anti-defense Tad2 family protein n=1 Tax=Xenorhabdus bovienii TaxID=40576 RepID=UPI003DA26889
MSKVNKPENNAALKCPFDPNQYHTDNEKIAVPVGSSAWALSQIFLGKQVHRSGWNAPIEHMRLAHKSEAGSADDGAAYIEKSDKDGYWSRWTPTQEDLLACDWNLLAAVCLEDSMLVFDLTVAKYEDSDDKTWGTCLLYCIVSFGDLKVIKNNTPIRKISIFYWIEYPDDDSNVPTLVFTVTSPDAASDEQVREFLEKFLCITVDGMTYKLGKVLPALGSIDGSGYGSSCWYRDTEAQRLGAMMKQNVGKTLRFYLNWK